ncbi:MAG: hypothetical protein IPK81_14070 [Rhodospirillales bacterium]|nr:MAG: hypothetical protein IPK81_14070 [Rhodospirillales bacterium]
MTPAAFDPLASVDASRGAPMGRASRLSPDFGGALRLAKVRLDSGGYDRGGAYWGCRERGESLFVAWSTEFHAVAFLDAPDRDTARARILARVPAAMIRH